LGEKGLFKPPTKKDLTQLGRGKKRGVNNALHRGGKTGGRKRREKLLGRGSQLKSWGAGGSIEEKRGGPAAGKGQLPFRSEKKGGPGEGGKGKKKRGRELLPVGNKEERPDLEIAHGKGEEESVLT